MNTQEELARELFIADNFNQPRESSIVDWEWFESSPARFRGRIEHYKVMALGVLAAGYRKPRTVTTAAELDALGFQAVILDPCGTPAVCQRSTQTESFWKLGGVGASDLIDSDTLLLSGSSCVVIHDGDVSHRAAVESVSK